MSFVSGLAWAYLKICMLAVAIMAAVWVACKVSVALHQRKNGPTDGDDPD